MNRFFRELQDNVSNVDPAVAQFFSSAAGNASQAAQEIAAATAAAMFNDNQQQQELRERQRQQQPARGGGRWRGGGSSASPQQPATASDEGNSSNAFAGAGINSTSSETGNFNFPWRNIPDIIQQAQQAAMMEQAMQQEQEAKVPPASLDAIRKLPMIVVVAEDLMADPNNRQCCICLEDNNVNDRVIRLPCSHIYHKACIVDWLSNHSCTCPTCRYELPTDDQNYERSRIQRMKERKPRFNNKNQLRRMSIKQLQAIFGPCPRHINDKNEWIQYLIDNEKIDLVNNGHDTIPSTSTMVEFKLSALRSMRVSELKETLANAGVFYNPNDVVEKEDIIQMFIHSGRLVTLPEENVEVDNIDLKMPASSNKTNSIADVQDQEADMEDKVSDLKISAAASRATNDMVVETVYSDHEQDEFELDIEGNLSTVGTTDWKNDVVMTEKSRQKVDEGDVITSTAVSSEITTTTAYAAAATTTTTSVNARGTNSSHRKRQRSFKQHENKTKVTAKIEFPSKFSHDFAPLGNLSISQMRFLARQLSIDISDCIERREMMIRITRNSETDLFAWPTTNLQIICNLNPELLEDTHFHETNREQIIDQIILAYCSSNKMNDDYDEKVKASQILRKQKITYCVFILPLLTKFTIQKLRELSKNWKISLTGCLEKSEIIQKLVFISFNK